MRLENKFWSQPTDDIWSYNTTWDDPQYIDRDERSSQFRGWENEYSAKKPMRRVEFQKQVEYQKPIQKKKKLFGVRGGVIGSVK